LLATFGGARKKDGGGGAGDEEDEEDEAEFVAAAQSCQFQQDGLVGIGVHTSFPLSVLIGEIGVAMKDSN
jgi:hypothetical protein